MNCGIIAVVMGIILSIIIYANFWALLKSMIGKKLSIIDQGLMIANNNNSDNTAIIMSNDDNSTDSMCSTYS